MYPLRFQPIFRRYLWGGRRLAEVLHKTIGDEPAAESWEIVDHEDDQSIVAFGPLKDQSLRQLIADQGPEILGESALRMISDLSVPVHLRNRFPLLLKFLDANQHLSVQVHPDDSYGAALSPPDLGKTEAWYVMHADPGAKIYAGLKHGITKERFISAVAAGQTESTLHAFEPQAGDCVFIRAGTMHAIGAGLLIAEIQQASNTTFRVFDWDRVDQDGNSRPLHIEQAIAVTDFSRGPVNPNPVGPVDTAGWSTLIECEKFVMRKATLSQPTLLGGDGQFHILAVTNGSLRLENDPSGLPLRLGQTCLLPACLDSVTVAPESEGAELLEIHVSS